MLTVTAPAELSKEELDKNQLEAETYEDYRQASERSKDEEIYAHDGIDHFWSMPDRAGDHADALNAQLDDLLAARKWLYVFLNFKYKDRSMPEDIVGVTEDCAYFPGQFDVWHECGRRRSFLERLPTNVRSPSN